MKRYFSMRFDTAPRPTKIDEKPETPGTGQGTFGHLEKMVENFISTKNYCN